MWGVSIPITNDSECTQYYKVEYKKDFEANYTLLVPNPVESPAVIEGLDAATTYNVRITRRCCNGQDSTPATTSFTTGG
jgi:hypothetical protein